MVLGGRCLASCEEDADRLISGDGKKAEEKKQREVGKTVRQGIQSEPRPTPLYMHACMHTRPR